MYSNIDVEDVIKIECGNDGDVYLRWIIKMDGMILEILTEQNNKG